MGKKKKICVDYEQELILAHERWEHLYQYGGSDPNWSDGCNMNLVRNHILYYKKKLEEENRFPEVYYREVPPEVDQGYMARAGEILANAAKSLNIYKNDSAYQFLVQNGSRINKKQADDICYGNVVGYVTGLQENLERIENASEREYSDILVRLRLHKNPERYLDAFSRCRQKMEAILASCQNSLWSFTEERSGQLRLF